MKQASLRLMHFQVVGYRKVNKQLLMLTNITELRIVKEPLAKEKLLSFHVHCLGEGMSPACSCAILSLMHRSG